MSSKTQLDDSRKHQLQLGFRVSSRRASTFAETQRGKILALLIAAYGAWVPLPEIMACAAQYNVRVLELRRFGFVIENKTERVNGARHSWFRLVSSPTLPAPKSPPKPEPAKPVPAWAPRTIGLLFDLEPRP